MVVVSVILLTHVTDREVEVAQAQGKNKTNSNLTRFSHNLLGV